MNLQDTNFTDERLKDKIISSAHKVYPDYHASFGRRNEIKFAPRGKRGMHWKIKPYHRLDKAMEEGVKAAIAERRREKIDALLQLM